MNDNGYTLGDLAAVTNGYGNGWNNGFGGGFGDLLGLIAIFALLGLSGGGFGNMFGNGFGSGMFYNGYAPQYATQDFVQAGFNFNSLIDGNRDLQNAIQNASNSTITAVKDGNASIIREFGNVETGIANLAGTTEKCCCDILRNIDSVNYNNAIGNANLQATIVAEAQKTRDLFTQNRMDDMQNRINQLELQNQLQGVVRYPNGFTYSAGNNPFCNCGCGCGNSFNI